MPPEHRGVVVAAYRAPYDDPISARAGDAVAIDDGRHTDIAGWIWCTNRQGKSGWVPEAYVDRRGDVGTLLCDYDAIELTVVVGDDLIVHDEESGFLWVTDSSGRQGWVPATHVQRSE